MTAAMTQLTGRRGQPTFGDNDDSDASWSPDGKWVLDSATYFNSAGEPNIWVVSADGTQLVRATNNLHEDGAPAMSPDGAWIYFESHVGSDGTVSQIWRISSPVRSDGSMQVFRPTTSSPVAASSPSAQNPCYVPNSNTLLFTEFTAGYNNPSGSGSAGLFSVAAAGGNPRTVVLHSGQSAVNLPGACYSPATGRIAYSSDLVNTDNIWTSLPGARNDSEHQVTCLTTPTLHAEEPSWSPDGKTLTYELDDDNDVNRATIWTIPANNNCAHPVVPTEIVPAPSGRCPGQKAPPPDNHEPNWSPNGKQIVFRQRHRLRRDGQPVGLSHRAVADSHSPATRTPTRSELVARLGVDRVLDRLRSTDRRREPVPVKAIAGGAKTSARRASATATAPPRGRRRKNGRASSRGPIHTPTLTIIRHRSGGSPRPLTRPRLTAEASRDPGGIAQTSRGLSLPG